MRPRAVIAPGNIRDRAADQPDLGWLEGQLNVAAARPRWVLLKNVPGLLSSADGRDFAAVLGALADLGYGFAWRVLDAQWFDVPQRRRRVFIVGHLGDPGPARRGADRHGPALPCRPRRTGSTPPIAEDGDRVVQAPDQQRP